jgi:hypothetical protein
MGLEEMILASEGVFHWLNPDSGTQMFWLVLVAYWYWKVVETERARVLDGS